MSFGPIALAPGFHSYQKINEQLYCQCFIPNGLNTAYVSYLQLAVASACATSGVPQVGAQVVASNRVFVLTEIRYTAYQNAVLIQFGTTVQPVPNAQGEDLKAATAPASTLPALEEAPDPSAAASVEGVMTMYGIDTAGTGVATLPYFSSRTDSFLPDGTQR